MVRRFRNAKECEDTAIPGPWLFEIHSTAESLEKTRDRLQHGTDWLIAAHIGESPGVPWWFPGPGVASGAEVARVTMLHAKTGSRREVLILMIPRAAMPAWRIESMLRRIVGLMGAESAGDWISAQDLERAAAVSTRPVWLPLCDSDDSLRHLTTVGIYLDDDTGQTKNVGQG